MTNSIGLSEDTKATLSKLSDILIEIQKGALEHLSDGVACARIMLLQREIKDSDDIVGHAKILDQARQLQMQVDIAAKAKIDPRSTDGIKRLQNIINYAAEHPSLADMPDIKALIGPATPAEQDMQNAIKELRAIHPQSWGEWAKEKFGRSPGRGRHLE